MKCVVSSFKVDSLVCDLPNPTLPDTGNRRVPHNNKSCAVEVEKYTPTEHSIAVHDDEGCNGRTYIVTPENVMSLPGRANSDYKSTKGEFKDYSPLLADGWWDASVASVYMPEAVVFEMYPGELDGHGVSITRTDG